MNSFASRVTAAVAGNCGSGCHCSGDRSSLRSGRVAAAAAPELSCARNPSQTATDPVRGFGGSAVGPCEEAPVAALAAGPARSALSACSIGSKLAGVHQPQQPHLQVKSRLQRSLHILKQIER